MRSTQESGQILRSKKRPRRTLRSGRGSRTNSNTSRQIPARVIDAAYDTLPAAGFCAETRAQPLIAPLAADLYPTEKVRLWLPAPHTGEIRPRNRSTSNT